MTTPRVYRAAGLRIAMLLLLVMVLMVVGKPPKVLAALSTCAQQCLTQEGQCIRACGGPLRNPDCVDNCFTLEMACVDACNTM